MTPRTVEDRLREEYFLLSPEIKRVVHRAELQVVSMLTGLFWQVEHGAFYKPRNPVLMGAARKVALREQTERVYDAFDELENTLERELQKDAELTTH